ncbi:RES family NAD+ phosphorylase [Larkinella humicola]|uniref:RES family NAD+ phosphorylase n=1 Tax=Larkinella humicola TaxID=2607654 RepID=A0A5N1JKE9_9BACT|nr:RES family NAD+ phosphorylase [Larkinella humicola]KAA9355260.1 RES family NAD+ phosphorylase [Larkinella humicola]
MALVYRIQKRQFVDSVLTGEGARLNGGRWNPLGTPLVYVSTTPELALLETLVHLDGTPVRDLPPFVRLTIELPDSIEELDPETLPTGWDQIKFSENLPFFLLPKLRPTYPILAFSVPSVILKSSPSRNLLINPLHLLMSQVKILEVIPHEFDERLRKPVQPPDAASVKGRKKSTGR